jgi:hypothetical protein
MRLEFFGIERLNFVEFNITGDDLNCKRLSEESRFISSEVFNLFTCCFEKSNELYDYFEPTKFNARKIVVLRNQLLAHLQVLNSIAGSKEFVDFIDDIFLGKAFLKEIETLDPSWRENWAVHLSHLVEINQEMINIVDRCIDEARILWIIGY